MERLAYDAAARQGHMLPGLLLADDAHSVSDSEEGWVRPDGYDSDAALEEHNRFVRRGRNPGRVGNRRRGLLRAVLMCLTLFGGGMGSPHESYSLQVASVHYPRAFLWDGLPSVWHERLDEIMDNRLSASSMSTVTGVY